MIELPAFLDGTAACAQPHHDPDLWNSSAPAARQEAKAICRRCPLMQACADYAITNNEPRGTWGGLTAPERRRLNSRPGASEWLDAESRVRKPCGTVNALSAHLRYGETCEICETAQAARTVARRRQRLAEEHAAGGSSTGAAIHRRLGEPVCGWCRNAERADGAARRQKQRARRKTQAPDLALAS